MAGAGYRTFYMTIRVRDETTRGFNTVRRSLSNLGDEGVAFGDKMGAIGQGLQSVGTAMAGLGASGATVLANFTNTALEFGRGTAYAFTQVDELGTNVEQLRGISKSVAEAVPVPIEQINEGLYDLFSTIDVSVGESEDLMMQLAKATIAGQTDMSTATRGTIAIMNAFKIPADKMNEVLDFQFQLVRKGAGTYSDFATTMGLSLPAFAAADQEVDTLGGTLTFLTRNGLSASRAATSAARAMEMLVKPDVVETLQEMGIEITKSDGSFQDLGYIMTQLADGPFKDLQGPQYVEMFRSIFGQGSIQGRRFYDLVLKNTDEYNERLDEFAEKAGAMEGAYDIMFNEGAIQSDLLRNQFELLKIEIGSILIPAFMDLLDYGQQIVDWVKELDPDLKEQIVKWTAIGSAILIAGGAILFLMGAAVMTSVIVTQFFAVVGKLVIGFFGLIKVVGLVWAAMKFLYGFVMYFMVSNPITFLIAAIIAALVALYIYWDDIWPVVKKVFDVTVDAIKGALPWIKEIAGIIWNALIVAYDALLTAAEATWGFLRDDVGDIIDIIVENSLVFWEQLQRIGDQAVKLGKYLYRLGKYLYEFAKAIILSDVVTKAATKAWDFLLAAGKRLGEFFVDLGMILWDFLSAVWRPFWGFIKDIAEPVWDALMSVLKGAIEIAFSAINAIMSIFSGDWDQFWSEIGDIFGAFVDILGALLGLAVTLLQEGFELVGQVLLLALETVGDLLLTGLSLFYDLGKMIIGLIIDGILIALEAIGDIAMWVWEPIHDMLVTAVSTLDEIGYIIIDNVWAGMQLAGTYLWTKGEEAAGWIKGIFWGVVNWFTGTGADIVDGIWEAIKTAFEGIKDNITEFGAQIGKWIGEAIKEGIKSIGGWLWSAGSWAMDKLGVTGQRGLITAARGMHTAYQAGGIVNGPTNALIGEAGAEAVVPLSRPGDAMAVLQNAGLDTSGLGGGGGITINIYGNVDDPDMFAAKVADAIGEEMFANGY